MRERRRFEKRDKCGKRERAAGPGPKFSCAGTVQPVGPLATCFRYLRRRSRCPLTPGLRTAPHRTHPNPTGPPVRPGEGVGPKSGAAPPPAGFGLGRLRRVERVISPRRQRAGRARFRPVHGARRAANGPRSPPGACRCAKETERRVRSRGPRAAAGASNASPRRDHQPVDPRSLDLARSDLANASPARRTRGSLWPSGAPTRSARDRWRVRRVRGQRSP